MNTQSLIAAAFIAASPLAFADNHASDELEWSMGNPVEIYGCSFKEGVDVINNRLNTPLQSMLGLKNTMLFKITLGS